VDEPLLRAAFAAGLAIVLAVGLGRIRGVPREAAMVGYAAVVIVLGIFAFLGLSAAVIGGAIVLLTLALGGVIYALLTLAAHWASR
jgi:hypothetical protein